MRHGPIKYVFDLDGTMALNQHRDHFIKGDKKDWDAYFKACIYDQPNIPVITAFNDLVSVYGWGQVQIWSGRSEDVKEETVNWLRTNVNPHVDRGLWAEILRMRPSGDFTPDDQLKMFWLSEVDRTQLIAVFDDRDKVVEMWRKNGVACFQVAPGPF